MKSTAQLDAPHKSTCQFTFMRQAMYEEEMRFKRDGLIIIMIPFWKYTFSNEWIRKCGYNKEDPKWYVLCIATDSLTVKAYLPETQSFITNCLRCKEFILLRNMYFIVCTSFMAKNAVLRWYFYNYS